MTGEIVPGEAISNYEASSLNALRHGVLSRHTTLPWEKQSEYETLLERLAEEYQPQGETEYHLVEELAGVMWRKRRLRMAEAAHYQKELHRHDDSYNHVAKAALACIHTKTSPHKFSYKDALTSSERKNRRDLKEIAEYREPAMKALAALEEGGTYEDALAMLAEVTRDWWQEDMLGEARYEGGPVWEPSADHLRHFLQAEVMPYYTQQHEDATHRALVKQQALGEAFIPDNTTEKLTRYETHLDRKFERTLSMLVKLQEMRANAGRTPD